MSRKKKLLIIIILVMIGVLLAIPGKVASYTAVRGSVSYFFGIPGCACPWPFQVTCYCCYPN